MNTRLLLTLAIMVAAATPASAQPEIASAKSDPDPRVSLTFSPVHLILPMVEVTGELRLAPNIGAAVILGGGSFSGERLGDPADPNRYSAFEIGGQFRYYLSGSFRSGLQVGGEVMYLTVSTDSAGVSATGEGLTAGPFVGYKHAWPIGLTLKAQIGGQLLLARAEAGDSSAEDREVGLLLNLNAGWSF